MRGESPPPPPPPKKKKKKAAMSGFDIFIDVSLNKLLNKTVKFVVIWGGMTPIWQEFNDKNMNIIV